MSVLNLKIITPRGVVWSSEASRLNIETGSGEITVLPNHAPLISKIAAESAAKISTAEGMQRWTLGEGVLEVRQNMSAY